MSTYKVITKDDEVTDIDDVQVEETNTVEKKNTTTLNFIQRHIVNGEAQIADIQKDIDEYEAKKVLVTAEAQKVTLKTEE